MEVRESWMTCFLCRSLLLNTTKVNDIRRNTKNFTRIFNNIQNLDSPSPIVLATVIPDPCLEKLTEP